MKKAMLVAALMVCAAGAFAQGFVQFNTKVGTSTTAAPGQVWAPVYLPEVGDPFLAKTGRTATGVPLGGTQTYTGGFVIGSGFTAQLWGGAVGSSEDQLVLVATTTFRTQTATTVAGTIVNPAAHPAVPGVAAGSFAALQLRAWDNRSGTVTSWAQVTASANDSIVARGVSPIFTTAFALSDGAPANPVPTLQGLQSFNLHLVPEPSAIALGVLGLGALVLFRRRK